VKIRYQREGAGDSCHTLLVMCVLVLMLCCPGMSNGQEAALDALIDGVQRTYERTPALTADFEQVATLTSLNRQQFSSGRVSIEKPHAIRWEYAQPEPQTILYDGALLRVYTPKRRQLLQSHIAEKQRANVALLFLAGVGNLREAFTVFPMESPDPQEALLRLLPHATQAGFAELHIAIDRRSHFVKKLLIHDTIGNLTEIRLSSLKVHAALPPQTFELSVPPDTEIITPTDPSGRK
jgi:outer membrane lipoprotein-sorting protein